MSDRPHHSTTLKPNFLNMMGNLAYFFFLIAYLVFLQVLICQVTCYIAEDQLFQWTEKVLSTTRVKQ